MDRKIPLPFNPEDFRKDGTALNRINSLIRDRIIKEGSFFIVQTELEGRIWLRVTIINPIISENDLRELIQRVIEIGRDMRSHLLRQLADTVGKGALRVEFQSISTL
jgi:glutamate/tyrosine decarboxylase-like PLP-dependent enzyme